ncbi:hypothetical protein AAGV32_13920, partial [Flavobacterium sp. FZUR7N2.5]
MVGLDSVDNTSDSDKPVSTATQTELDLKANLESPTFTGTVSGIDKTMVGLANVDNTSDANKPVSTTTQTALDLKANLESPTFTGTVSGITRSMVGLDSVDNTSDLDKPVSTATQTALDLKENTANKSTDVATDGTSDIKYPSVKSVKSYVDSEVAAINSLADGKIYLGNASDLATEVTLTGDVTINNAGVSTIGESKVVSSMIKDGTISTVDIATDAVTSAKILDANVTYAKIQNVNSGKVLGRATTGTGIVEEISTTGTGDVVRSSSPVFTGTITAVNISATTVASNLVGNVIGNVVGNVLGNATNVNGVVAVINGGTGVTTSTGTGSVVLSASPTLVTPVLGVATATSVNGTSIPTSKTLVVTTDKLSALSATTSAEFAGVISDETGTGSVVLSASPTFTGTPSLPTGTIGVTQTAGNNTTALATTAF